MIILNKVITKKKKNAYNYDVLTYIRIDREKNTRINKQNMIVLK